MNNLVIGDKISYEIDVCGVPAKFKSKIIGTKDEGFGKILLFLENGHMVNKSLVKKLK